MATQRPTVDPDVIATVTAQAPDRVRRKVDCDPEMADGWSWTQDGDDWQIDTGNECVQMTATSGHVKQLDDVKCSCLLSPRCFHLLACLSVLEVATAEQEDADEKAANQDDAQTDAEPHDAVELTDAQQTAASSMWKPAAALLAAGARSTGSLLQANLLRAIHECRSQGLHRLASAGLRVIQNVRQARSGGESFDSETLTADLADLFETAWRLSHAEEAIDTAWIGTARRRYTPITSLKLCGLFSEPVLTRSGYAGVVTYFLRTGGDREMDVVSISNVRPGPTSRIAEAFKTGIDFGGLTLSHARASRHTLLVQNGTVSLDRRLGSGKDCRAAAIESDGWSDGAIADRFNVPFEQQINSVFSRMSNAAENSEMQPAGWDLLFLRGKLIGAAGPCLLLELTENQALLRLAIQQDLPDLAFRENLEMLARAPGLPVRCIARLSPTEPYRAALVALSEDDSVSDKDAPSMRLPETLGGHVNIGLERLQRGVFTSAEREPVILHAPEAKSGDDGLTAMSRRIRALATGGRHSLPTNVANELNREARRFEEQMQPAAASLLAKLAESSLATETTNTGLRFPADPSELAISWLSCAKYLDSANKEFHRRLWL